MRKLTPLESGRFVVTFVKLYCKLVCLLIFHVNKYFVACEAVACALYCVVEKACTLV